MFNEQIFRDYAMRFVGQPYIWGGDDPMRGWDCSGLVQELLAAFGVDFPGDQTAQALFNLARNAWTLSPPAAGSVIFYGKNIATITHVAMMIDDTSIIEAGGGGSKTLTEDDAIKQNAYVRMRPVSHRKDFVSCLRPKYP